MSTDLTKTQRIDAALASRLGDRGWIVAAAGAVIVIVSALMPWTYTDRSTRRT